MNNFELNSSMFINTDNSQSELLLMELFGAFNLDVKNLDSKQYEKFSKLCNVKTSHIKKVLDNFNLIVGFIDVDHLNLDVIAFLIKLSQIGVFDDFIDVIDDFSVSDCDLDDIKLLKSINFSKIKKFKTILKKRDPDLKLNISAISRLNLIKSFEFIGNSPLLMCVEEDNVSSNFKNFSVISTNNENFDYIYSMSKNYSVLNFKNFDYVFLRHKGENEYTFGSTMPYSNEFLIGLALKKLFDCLPNGANIIEDGTLSGDSFPLLLNLYKKQKNFNLNVSITSQKSRLNLLGCKSELSKLIREKDENHNSSKLESLNIPSSGDDGSILSLCNSIKNKFFDLFAPDPDSPIFETVDEADALCIVNEFNDLISVKGLSGIKHLSACVEYIKSDDKWGVRLPSFKIVKNASI